MSKIKTLKHITFITAVCFGMASVFTFIDGGRSTLGAITGGIFFTAISISYLLCYFHLDSKLNSASK